MGHSAGSGSGAIRRGTDGNPYGRWGGSDQGTRALQTGTYLREEANEKCAGVLGEKLRGLSKGLLPVAERGGSLGLGWAAIPLRLLISNAGCKQQPVPFSPTVVSGPRPSKSFWLPSMPSRSKPILPSSGMDPPLRHGSSFLPHPLFNLGPPTKTLLRWLTMPNSDGPAPCPIRVLLCPDSVHPSCDMDTSLACGQASSSLGHTHHLSHPGVQAVGSGVAAAWAKCWSR